MWACSGLCDGFDVFLADDASCFVHASCTGSFARVGSCAQAPCTIRDADCTQSLDSCSQCFNSGVSWVSICMPGASMRICEYVAVSRIFVQTGKVSHPPTAQLCGCRHCYQYQITHLAARGFAHYCPTQLAVCTEITLKAAAGRCWHLTNGASGAQRCSIVSA
jgi:hypothetical protein